jgi:hypothetical protein
MQEAASFVWCDFPDRKASKMMPKYGILPDRRKTGNQFAV